MDQKKLDFWNQRALSAEYPGSDDYVSQGLEQNFIIHNTPPNARVLDIGCGDGSTLKKLFLEKGINGIGADYSSEMVQCATKINAGNEKISFINKSVLELSVDDLGQFDVIYTQRCLINLDSFEEQIRAITNISSLLKPNGVFLMVENTLDGLEYTNDLRALLGLELISPPWHNVYFRIGDLEKLKIPNFSIEKREEISSTYYYISRVIYAKSAADKGEVPVYDSAINKISTQLPQNISTCGPTKGWIWRKKG